MSNKTDLMKKLIELYEQYSFIENDHSAITIDSYIQEQESKLLALLSNKSNEKEIKIVSPLNIKDFTEHEQE